MRNEILQKIKQEKTLKELLEFSILNIDKSSGPTSFDISDFVRKKLNALSQEIKIKKTSHFGTLDPKVTGVLPIAINRACKLTGYFIGHDKEYVGVMKIHEPIPLKKIEKEINENFLGIIKQTPPVKSRVKRQEREREIKKFKILETGEDKKTFLFHVVCEGGTYIRKLISDLGENLNVGAHMLELRRTRAGIFSEQGNEICVCPSVNLYDFEKAVNEFVENKNEKLLREILIPAEIVSEIFPIVKVKNSFVQNLYTGKSLRYDYLAQDTKKTSFKKEEKLCIFSEDNKFIEIACVTLEDDAGILARPDFVLQPLR